MDSASAPIDPDSVRWEVLVTNRFAAYAVLIATGSVVLAAAQPGEQKTVTGWVLDSACAFTKGLSKPISRDCALACARNGSPLVILQDDGSIYWPISESMPAVKSEPAA